MRKHLGTLIKQNSGMKSTSPQWQLAHRKLLDNVRKQNFLIKSDECKYTLDNDQKVYLPAYIPFIGAHYFNFQPRVLCYAINQNLSNHAPWTNSWIRSWAQNEELAHDRLNRAAFQRMPIPIKPYVEGFIPLVALIAIRIWQRINGGTLPQIIDDVVAVTNFIKFSTVRDASSSRIPLIWWRECGELYSREEIMILQPDIILAFGRKTFSETKRILEDMVSSESYLPKVVYCRFPSRIASNKGRPLNKSEIDVWNNKIADLLERVKKPKKGYYHQNKMEQYKGYFIDMESQFRRDFVCAE